MGKYATITLELYKNGIMISCEDIGDDEFIEHGNGNKIMDFINHVEDICDPDARFELTEEGLKYVEELNKLKDEEV